MTDGFGGYDPTFDNAAAHALNTYAMDWTLVDPAQFAALQAPMTLASGAVVNQYVGRIKAMLAAGQVVSATELAYARYQANGGVTAFLDGGSLQDATGNPNSGGRVGLCYFNPSGIGWLTITEAQARGGMFPVPVTFKGLVQNDVQPATSTVQTVTSDQVKAVPVDVPAPVVAPVVPAAPVPVTITIHNNAPAPTAVVAPVQPVTLQQKVTADVTQRESKLIADLKAATLLDWAKAIGILLVALRVFRVL